MNKQHIFTGFSKTRTKVLKSNKLKNDSKLFIAGSMAALLAACKGKVPVATAQDTLQSEGQVQGTPSTGNDVLVLGLDGNATVVATGAGNDVVTGGSASDVIDGGSGADVVNGGGGNDIITGGAGADLLRGGAGNDQLLGGAGKDSLVIIGVNTGGTYTASDINNPNGTGVDLSSLISLEDINDNAVSDVASGGTIDGGLDGATLYIYGKVDLSNVTLKNITVIDVHSILTLSASQINELMNDELVGISGDGDTILIIKDSADAVTLDFTGLDLKNIGTIIIGDNVTLIVDQVDIESVTDISGEGTLKAATGSLNLDGIHVESVLVLDSDGFNIAHAPKFDANEGDDDFDHIMVDENYTEVGNFAATDADGDVVSYSLSGEDADLFSINDQGDLKFITAPDYEARSSDYHVTLVATTGSMSTQHRLEIEVGDQEQNKLNVVIEQMEAGGSFSPTEFVDLSAGDHVVYKFFTLANLSLTVGDIVLNGSDLELGDLESLLELNSAQEIPGISGYLDQFDQLSDVQVEQYFNDYKGYVPLKTYTLSQVQYEKLVMSSEQTTDELSGYAIVAIVKDADDEVTEIFKLGAVATGDFVAGDDEDNVFDVSGGNNFIDGGVGIDTYAVSGAVGDYLFIALDGELLILNATEANDILDIPGLTLGNIEEHIEDIIDDVIHFKVDILHSVEKIQFSDALVAVANLQTFSLPTGFDGNNSQYSAYENAEWLEGYNYDDIYPEDQLLQDGDVSAAPTQQADTITLGADGEYAAAHTGGGDDNITGGIGNDYIRTGSGNDVVNSGGGDDSVYGGSGNDQLNGGDGIDDLWGEQGDDILHGNGGNDYLRDDAGNNQLFGDGGNDTFVVESGTDLIDGGEGSDTAGYSYSRDGININLALGTASGGDAEGDTLISIENVYGSYEGDDVIIGNDADNLLIGNGGDDELSGGTGDDELRGGEGADVLKGGDGDDYVDGGIGDDMLFGGNQDDILTGVKGSNQVSGGTGTDTIAEFADGFGLVFMKDDGKIKLEFTGFVGDATQVDILQSVEFFARTHVNDAHGEHVDSIDLAEIYDDLDSVEQAKFTDEADYLAWLGNDAGYNYEGL